METTIDMELLNEYQNGNYTVSLFDNGTKVRATQEDDFIPSFAECMDVKITNYCDMGCKFCHEDSTTEGLHGDILNSEVISSLHPFTEIAIGGGNPLSHPDLLPFLKKLKQNNVIANMTVNQKHFMESVDFLRMLSNEKLIYGMGVSFVNYSKDFVEKIKLFPNAVIHVINGVTPLHELRKLYDKNLKVLILGYKYFRRGVDFYSSYSFKVEDRKSDFYHNIVEILKHFNTVSFDNLAIEQLDVQRCMSKEKWGEFYMGDDGQYTFYIDLVTKTYSKSSFSKEKFPLKNSVDEMFKHVVEL